MILAHQVVVVDEVRGLRGSWGGGQVGGLTQRQHMLQFVATYLLLYGVFVVVSPDV